MPATKFKLKVAKKIVPVKDDLKMKHDKAMRKQMMKRKKAY